MRILRDYEGSTFDAGQHTYCRPGVRREPPHPEVMSLMTAQTLPDNPNFCFCPALRCRGSRSSRSASSSDRHGRSPCPDRALRCAGPWMMQLSMLRQAEPPARIRPGGAKAMAAASMHAEDDNPDGGAWTLSSMPPPSTAKLRRTLASRSQPPTPDNKNPTRQSHDSGRPGSSPRSGTLSGRSGRDQITASHHLPGCQQ